METRVALPLTLGLCLAASPPAQAQSFHGEYFDTIDLSGPAQPRDDARVDFDWALSSPRAGIAPNTFSVRWTGFATAAYSEPYTFTVVSDDGVRLYVDGALVIDAWTDQSATARSAVVALTAGQTVSIRMEYYDNGWDAVAQLLWSSPSQPQIPVPPAYAGSQPDAGVVDAGATPDAGVPPDAGPTNAIDGGPGGSGGPDIYVTGAFLEDASASPGDRVSVEYTMRNRGSEDADEFHVGYYMSTDAVWSMDDTLMEDEEIGEVEVGDPEDESDQVEVPSIAPGTRYVLVVLDHRGEIMESDESNNVAALAIQIL